MTPLPVKIVGIGSRQHGIVDLEELELAGVARSSIAAWVRTCRLFRLHRGVYSIVPPSMLTQEGRWLAAVRACGSRAALSHGPAGQLAGFINRRENLALHVSVSHRGRIRLPGIVVHRPRSLPPSDLTCRLQIPTTTPARTLWDLSPVLPALQLRRAFARAERYHPIDRARLSQLLIATPNHKGAATLRELFGSRPIPLSEVRSWLEELLVLVCSEHSLPLPTVNVLLLGYEVDFLWPEARFVVEADGSSHLDSGRRDRDNERDATLGRAGYLVRRYSFRAMNREREVAEEVRGILEERLPADTRI
ncbi:MAG: DUF559 domain-containing protein [Solirubrobacterales bacterium]|nr:DUF559 domain-containing protein [Solirubrobacterales bacterium]